MRYSFPPEFDSGFYVQCKPYLAGAPKDLLEQEFRKFGIPSGTPGSILCYREHLIKFLNAAPGKILEIGPGGNPDFSGANVKYLDAFTTAEMRERYPSKTDNPPEIDYLVKDLVNGNIGEKFDLVYSAHNFEHQANPVMHIMSVNEILMPGGYFVAVVPDRNYTFDYFRSTSTLVDILSAPDSQAEHSARSRLNHFNRTHNNCYLHWFGDHGQQVETASEVIEEYAKLDNATFRSLHVNTFEPESFKTIFSLLSAKGIIPLKLLRVYNTPFLRNEFATVFYKPANSGSAMENEDE